VGQFQCADQKRRSACRVPWVDWISSLRVGAGANVLSFGRFQNAEGDRGVLL
jgi:hypothetical protein